MREIVMDTETTGLDPKTGDRLVEIGAVEIINYMPTGQTFHRYINPERDMPEEAYKVHGLSSDFLADKPRFSEVVDAFLDFIADDPLVIHNASFDMKFLNHELEMAGHKVLPANRAIDSLEIARRTFPGAPNSLDALCKRFNVDLSVRVKHGALLDSELLAEVYLNLMGGRQTGLDLSAEAAKEAVDARDKPVRPARSFPIPAEDLANHEAFVASIENAIWRQV